MTTSPITPSPIPAQPVSQSDKARGKTKSVDRGTQTDNPQVVYGSSVLTTQRTLSQNKQRSPRAVTLADAPEHMPSDAAAAATNRMSLGQRCRAYFAKKKAALKEFFKHDPNPTHELSEHYKGRDLFRNI